MQLGRSRTVGTLIFFVIAGTSVGAVAAWNGYKTQDHNTELTGRALGFAPALRSNASSKSDRLPLVKASFTLASVDPSDLAREPAEQPLVPKSVPTIAAVPVEKPAVAALPREEKSKPLPPPPAQARSPHNLPANAVLDESQIASLKERLRLTPDQAGYWPAVESALIEVVRVHAREARAKRGRAAPPRIDVNSAEVQKLIYAATPLIMRLREDQKKEVRTMARVMGLDSVASQI